MRVVNFVETSFTGRAGSNVVRYSSTNNGLPSNNRFLLQGKVVEINIIRESTCIAFTHIFLMYQWDEGLSLVIRASNDLLSYYIIQHPMVAEYGAL
jgi:hypothetical protein